MGHLAVAIAVLALCKRACSLWMIQNVMGNGQWHEPANPKTSRVVWDGAAEGNVERDT